MISKTDILKMVRSVTRRGQGYTERRAMNPHREWFIGVGLFMVISIVGGVMNARNYVYYNTLESEITHTTAPIKKYREATAVDAIERYTEKQVSFDALASDVPLRPDTSTSTATTSADMATSTGTSVLPVDAGTGTTTAETE